MLINVYGFQILQLSYNKTQRFLERCMKIRLFYILMERDLGREMDLVNWAFLLIEACRLSLPAYRQALILHRALTTGRYPLLSLTREIFPRPLSVTGEERGDQRSVVGVSQFGVMLPYKLINSLNSIFIPVITRSGYKYITRIQGLQFF